MNKDEPLEIKNAIINAATIDADDHGMLTAWLRLDYGGWMQGFGGYTLYKPKFPKSPNYAGHFMWRVMKIVGVTEWKDMIGKTIRVKCNHCGIEAIGHIVEDSWFYPKEEFAELKTKGSDD